MEFNYFDIIVSVIVLFLGLKGIINGFFKELFGLLGIVAGILIGVYTALKLVKPNLKIPPVGAIFAILFEIIIGGWLIYYSI